MSGELHKVFGKPDIYQCIFLDPYNIYIIHFAVFSAPQLTTTPGPGDPKEQAASDDDDDLALSKGK